MARATATSDVYNAIAEPRRREILELLGEGEWAVQDLVEAMDIGQATVSGHLRVLKEVELVTVRRDGRWRFYSVNGEALQPVHDWVERFERFWTHQLDRVQARAEGKKTERRSRKEKQ